MKTWMLAALLSLLVSPAAARAEVKVLDLVVAHGVEARMPKDVGDRFPAGDMQLWGHATLENADGPTKVRMVWRQGEVERFSVELDVGQSRTWRTWSRKRLSARDAGNWTLEVQALDGTPLKTVPFEVVMTGL